MDEKLTQLKIEMIKSPIFNYENYLTPFELWKCVMQRIEELENDN